MGNLWLKIKIWTKSILVGALVIYALLFMLKNSGQSVNIWWWFGYGSQTSMLVLIVVTFLAGVIGTILVRTTLRTLRQIRDMRQQSRLDRVEREHADMKAKAAMLQSRTSAPAAVSPPIADEAASTSDQSND